MTTIRKKTIYLNTADVHKLSTENNCDTTFDVSRFGLQCNNDQKLSMALVRCMIPTVTSYLENSGIKYVFSINTTEPPTVGGGVSLTTTCVLAISDSIYQPPFYVASEDNIVSVIPFYIAQSVDDIVNILNILLDARMAGDDEAQTILAVNSHTGYLEADDLGATQYKLSIQNSYFWQTENGVFGNDFTKVDGVKIAKLLGINTIFPQLTQAFTVITNLADASINREPHLRHPAFISSEGLLIQTNLNFDSFCSVENGQSNVLSNIPTVVGVQNRTFFVQGVGSDDVLLGEYRVGNIVHQSKNIVNAHKTLSDKNVTSIRLLVKGFENDVRWCNTNITYVLEVRWLV